PAERRAITSANLNPSRTNQQQSKRWRRTIEAASATLLAIGRLAGQASARTVFDDLNETAPHSAFSQLNDTAPRSAFDDLNDSAPRSTFDDLNDSAPRTDGVYGGLQNDAP